jgi:Ca-activated chloride channel family protein
MRRKMLFLPTIVLLIGLLFSTVPAYADGIIIPQPPICHPGPCPRPIPISQLAIEYHHVDVEIREQVAVTHVDQVFRNDNDWTIEGIYVFPLPKGATVNAFTLWIDGEPVDGKVLTKEEARQTYEQIVREMRDPALLEYIDREAVQASIFPIPPGGESRIELEYSQILEIDNGLIHYRYPLNTEKFSTLPLEEVVISVDVQSPQSVRAVYSPSHQVAVEREDSHRFSVGYEEFDITPDKDFDLYYSISNEDIGLNLLTFKDPENDDPHGFFLLLAAPSFISEQTERVAKDVLLVLDKSGSMDGEKFRQAQDALRYVLNHLNSQDRFNIIAFSTGTDSFAEELQPASEADEAIRWVDSLSAAGSTDINRALLEAIDIASRERPTILIFMTDGLPTEGVTDRQMILQNVERDTFKAIRLFAFGVGFDVDTYLLDSLAQDNRGTTTYVTPNQAIDETVSAFYNKVSLPVLTDIEIDFGDIVTFDLYPQPLPDLFAGSQIILVGRYRGSGYETISLSGVANEDDLTFIYSGQRFRSSGGEDFLPRLWATRKIGSLLNQARLQGPDEETVAQIVQLSIRYGIVTPYTSYLVTEPMALGVKAQEGIADHAFDEMLAAPMEVSGEKAVGRAAAESNIRSAEVAPQLDQSSADVVRLVGSRTFSLVDGIWIDTSYDPEMMTTLQVPFLSADYFTLADSRSELGDAFALGQSVIIVVEGIAYEVIGAEGQGDQIIIPKGQVQEEETAEDVDVDPSSNLTPDTKAKNSPLPCVGSSLLVFMVALPFGLSKISRCRQESK